jgi:hypothetical protein
MTKIEIGTRVVHPEEWVARRNGTGTVIEVNDQTQRARVKWDNGNPRTWIAFGRLKVVPGGFYRDDHPLPEKGA